MNKIDLEHRLQKGSILYIGNIPVYKISIGEMVDFPYGYSTCNYLINLLCMDDEKSCELSNNNSITSTFEFIMIQLYSELIALEKDQVPENTMNNLLTTTMIPLLEMIFRDDVHCNFQNMCLSIGKDKNKLLNIHNYNEFRTILKERNCLMDIDGFENIENPDNEMVQKLLEKRRILREKLKNAKKNENDENGVTIADLISIFAEAEKMPLQDVYDNYDIYQFNNQFNRLKIMEDYQVNIKALLAGAKKEEIKLQHWLSKIKSENP